MAKRKAAENHDPRAPKAAKKTQPGGDALNDVEQTSSQSKDSHGADEVERSAGSSSPASNSERVESKSSNHVEDGRGLQFLSLLTEACEQRRTLRQSKLSDLDEDSEPFIPKSERTKVFEKLQQSGKRRLQMIIRKLSDANKTELAGEKVLTMLPLPWFSQLISLREYQVKYIQKAETELALVTSQLEEAYTNLSEQVAQRCRGLEDLSDEFTEEGGLRSLHIQIMETNKDIQRYYLHQVSLQDKLDVFFSELWDEGEHLLEAADSDLVAAGFLTVTQEGKGEDHDQEGLSHGSGRGGKKGYASQLNDGASQSHFHNQASDNHGQSHNPEGHVALLQHESSRYLAEAKRAYSQASKAFHNVRETYDRRYQFFRNEVEAGRIVDGTKTTFDAEYFLDRNRLNRRLTVAEEQWWAARKDAQRTGALPLAHHTSDFADRSDDGHTPQEIEAYVASFDMARIERWRSDGAQKDIEQDESKWELGLPDYEAEIASVAVISSTSQDRYDTSRRSKLIARWRKEQEDTRKIELRRWRKAMKG
ncbi:hypothetical protein KC338_g7487 [Hortaea werneckii]|nr:hypothetical protein KC338_g7487 [Hortaea werneckii]